MAYVVTAKWTSKEGEEEAVAEAVRNLLAPSRAEPGILFCQPHRDPENPRVSFFYEQYSDPTAYEAHVASDHFKQWGFGDAIPRLEARERAFFETWDA